MATTPLQTLTLDEKLQVSLKIQRTPKIQNADVIDWVQTKFKKSVSISTIRRIRYKPPTYFCSSNTSATRRRRVKFPELEQQLLEFFHRQEGSTIISDDILLMKARDLKTALQITDDQLRLSNGWLAKFKKRNGISSKRLHGEVDAVTTVQVRSARCLLQEITNQ
ncbi:hypothetical protein F443_19415 [Phytophthora nicotianae P1569]|uniref:HTH CENPB-type domain-containing protein n=1 Tax=Phytophthora nicotianae P1569 TaxID=1317065 RepID=V9E4H0_PHYNI|nr:hypothetical protein F443_19415 [Phytophthora nicotianae P1569]